MDKIIETVKQYLKEQTTRANLQSWGPTMHLVEFVQWQRAKRRREDLEILIYNDARSEYRWTITDKTNGKTVGSSSQGYSREDDCRANLFLVTGWEADEYREVA